MHEYRESINRQYGTKNLNVRLVEAIRTAGTKIDKLTLSDLFWFDQHHAGGVDSTRALASMAGLKTGMEVLDVGSGVGGSSRILAVEYGCRVTGVDITMEYVKAAQMLTDMVGLSGKVTFIEGNALELDFEGGTFDAVWTQSTIMNIENIVGFFREVHRVLRPNGVFAVEAVVKGSGEETQFPVFWADNQSVSFLKTPDYLRQMLGKVGFDEIGWRDVTQESIESRRRVQSHPLQHVFNVIQPGLAEKIMNTSAGFQDGVYRGIYGIYKKRTEAPTSSD